MWPVCIASKTKLLYILYTLEKLQEKPGLVKLTVLNSKDIGLF